MKSYNTLTKKQKEMFNAYLRTRTIFAIKFYSFFILSGLFILFSIFLVSVNSIVAFIFGIYNLIIAFLLLVLILIIKANEEKFSTLVFGIENSQEDLFEITDEDLKNMKRKWTKVK